MKKCCKVTLGERKQEERETDLLQIKHEIEFCS